MGPLAPEGTLRSKLERAKSKTDTAMKGKSSFLGRLYFQKGEQIAIVFSRVVVMGQKETPVQFHATFLLQSCLSN